MERKDFFKPFSDGDYLKLLKAIITGNPNLKEANAKGCGFDVRSDNTFG